MDEVETREQKLLRVLYHLARVEIAQMSTGFVATSGKAQIVKPLQSPLTKRECIAYQLSIFYRPTSQAYNWLRRRGVASSSVPRWAASRSLKQSGCSNNIPRECLTTHAVS